VHRPMSLLLQALKQIELKAPSIATGPDLRIEAGAPLEADVDGKDVAEVLAPVCNSIDLIRHYEPFETATEIALAAAAPITLVPVIESPIQVPSATISRDFQRRRRFAGDLLTHLPNDDRAIIALAPAEGIDPWPVMRELCVGLAARDAGDVLAVAEAPKRTNKGRDRYASLSELISAPVDSPGAACSVAEGPFFLMERGDGDDLAMASPRSLLRLWQQLNDRYAYVVVDVGRPDTPEAKSLLASCDGAFAIVRLNRTHRRDAERLVAQIRAARGRTCGCLVVD
jgi:hypothetical protein